MPKNNPALPAFNFDRFPGFGQPNSTQVPDILFDQIMQDLDEKELKVLLYIIRRTFGFKKSTDNISLNQMVNGITTRTGKTLDRGTGLSKASVARALNSLKQKNLINATQNRNAEKGNLPTTYSLRMYAGGPCLTVETRGVSAQKQALVSRMRHTTNSKTINSSTTAVTAKSQSYNSEIAAVLVKKGIDQQTARNLVTRYRPERVLNNVDLLEHLQKTSPQAVSKNPAGWLRRAIEQDFAATGQHQGFRTRKQKAAQAAAKKQRLAAQQKHAEAHEREQRTLLQEQQSARRKRLATLRERYSSTAQEQKLWTEVLKRLKEKTSKTTFNLYLAQTDLLSIWGNQAVIAVPNVFIRDFVAKRWADEIEQVLCGQGKQQKARLQFLLLDEAGDG